MIVLSGAADAKRIKTMPKGKLQISKGVQRIVARTNKIGGRKSTKAANMMSTEELTKIAESGSRRRDRQTARQEIEKRNPKVDF
jgi:hypothetical protein